MDASLLRSLSEAREAVIESQPRRDTRSGIERTLYSDFLNRSGIFFYLEWYLTGGRVIVATVDVDWYVGVSIEANLRFHHEGGWDWLEQWDVISVDRAEDFGPILLRQVDNVLAAMNATDVDEIRSRQV